MEAISNKENQVLTGKPLVNKPGKKPLGGIGIKVANVPTKAITKPKNQIGIFADRPKPMIRTRNAIKDDKIFEKAIPEIEESLPIIPIKEKIKPEPLPENVANIDAEDSENPQLVSIYVMDIYKYLRSLEVKYPIKKHHLQFQKITGRMRTLLVDWLIQVHLKFHLLQETLYLTISILDRYLQVELVTKSELQLVGVTSMFIASKYEEMYSPDIGDFVYITDNSYTKNDVLKMERKMLSKLDFNLSKPLPLHFLRRNSKAGNVDATIHTLAKYLMEITLPEYELAHYAPSLLAAAALYLSLKLLSDIPWSETLQYYSQYKEEDLMPLVRCLCKVLVKADSSKFRAVHNKYASSNYLKISTIPHLKSSIVKTLAM